MGATYVNVTVRNPAERHRTWTGEFLVDTGAWDSVVPRSHLVAIGLSPRGSRQYSLADGSRSDFELTVAEIEFEGETVGGTVLYGEEGTQPLLGVTALGSGGYEDDPRNERLKKRRSLLVQHGV